MRLRPPPKVRYRGHDVLKLVAEPPPAFAWLTVGLRIKAAVCAEDSVSCGAARRHTQQQRSGQRFNAEHVKLATERCQPGTGQTALLHKCTAPSERCVRAHPVYVYCVHPHLCVCKVDGRHSFACVEYQSVFIAPTIYERKKSPGLCMPAS